MKTVFALFLTVALAAFARAQGPMKSVVTKNSSSADPDSGIGNLCECSDGIFVSTPM
jgi:hypothetical protein